MPKAKTNAGARGAQRRAEASPMYSSSRPRRVVRDKKPIPRFFDEPFWGTSSASHGGTFMVVTLGPAASQSVNYGSVPSPSTPKTMKMLLEGDYASAGWIAGHLLNDNLGGPGTAENLTPLTTAGNKNHLNTCETKIKNFLDRSFSRAEKNPGDAFWIGVHYEVRVGDLKWGTTPPLSFVAQCLDVHAFIVKQDKATLKVTEATEEEAYSISGYFTKIQESIPNDLPQNMDL